VIKEYFSNYFLHMSDVTFDMVNNDLEIHNNTAEPWRVTLVDTGQDTMTGGRLKRVSSYLDENDFCLTYGDGLCDVDISRVIDFHKEHGALATVTAIQPPGRFGALEVESNLIKGFQEKPEGDGGWINGGFFVLSPKVLDYINDDLTVWEKEPMERLASEGQLAAYKHSGFWQCMDTLRDRALLEELWDSGRAPWKIWQ
jgi:glucose-1-phosphate cytidylyltransferase